MPAFLVELDAADRDSGEDLIDTCAMLVMVGVVPNTDWLADIVRFHTEGLF